MAHLIAKEIVKRYRKRAVVDAASLTVASGEVVGLLGPNGAGKTTCFYMMVGLIHCDEGRVLLDDRDLTHLPMHARARLGVGYLPQEPSVFRRLSVLDNVLAILETRRDLAKADRRPLAEDCCTNCTSAICTPAWESACPAANGGGWKSPALWPPIRRLSCSTNPSPESIRCRCWTFSGSSPT